MPIVYDVDERNNFVHVRVTEQVTEAELLDHAARFLADPRIKPGFRELFDATGAVASGISKELVSAILDLDSHHVELFEGSKTALVIPDELGARFAQEFEKRAPGTVIVFWSLDVAKTWLGYEGPLGRPAVRASMNDPQ